MKLFFSKVVKGIILSSFIFLFVFASKPDIVNKSVIPLNQPPNILWLVTEDMGSYIPAFGDTTISTPNLTRLANEGVIYPNLFSPSGVCSPSRAAIASGMYPTSFGANNMRTKSYTEVTGLPVYEPVPPPEMRMMSELLRKNGYYCTNNSKEDYQFKAPITAWDESSSYAHWRNRKKGQPFFAVFNFNVTHESGLFEPYGFRKSELRHYESGNRDFVIESGKTKDEETTIYLPKSNKFTIPPYLPDNEVVQHDYWKLYNNIAEMDRQVGAILHQLETDGLLENTIVFFYADHGGPMPRQKRLIYDSGLNAPLIIRYLNKKNAGTTDNQLISFIDLAPTVLSLSGIKPPQYMQGQSFLGEYKAAQKRTYIHAAADRFDGFTDAIRAVRDKKFKYIRNYRPEQAYYLPVEYREKIPTMKELLRLHKEGKLNKDQEQWFRKTKDTEELYDCENDPHELNNLASNSNYATKIKELRNEMNRWLLAIGDQPNIPERELIKELWQGEDYQPQTQEPKIQNTNGIVSISCSTNGASIGYKVIEKDGEEPVSWAVYMEPITITDGSQILTIAHRIGFKASEIIKYN